MEKANWLDEKEKVSSQKYFLSVFSDFFHNALYQYLLINYHLQLLYCFIEGDPLSKAAPAELRPDVQAEQDSGEWGGKNPNSNTWDL